MNQNQYKLKLMNLNFHKNILYLDGLNGKDNKMNGIIYLEYLLTPPQQINILVIEHYQFG